MTVVFSPPHATRGERRMFAMLADYNKVDDSNISVCWLTIVIFSPPQTSRGESRKFAALADYNKVDDSNISVCWLMIVVFSPPQMMREESSWNFLIFFGLISEVSRLCILRNFFIYFFCKKPLNYFGCFLSSTDVARGEQEVRRAGRLQQGGWWRADHGRGRSPGGHQGRQRGLVVHAPPGYRRGRLGARQLSRPHSHHQKNLTFHSQHEQSW